MGIPYSPAPRLWADFLTPPNPSYSSAKWGHEWYLPPNPQGSRGVSEIMAVEHLAQRLLLSGLVITVGANDGDNVTVSILQPSCWPSCPSRHQPLVSAGEHVLVFKSSATTDREMPDSSFPQRSPAFSSHVVRARALGEGEGVAFIFSLSPMIASVLWLIAHTSQGSDRGMQG